MEYKLADLALETIEHQLVGNIVQLNVQLHVLFFCTRSRTLHDCLLLIGPEAVKGSKKTTNCVLKGLERVGGLGSGGGGEVAEVTGREAHRHPILLGEVVAVVYTEVLLHILVLEDLIELFEDSGHVGTYDHMIHLPHILLVWRITALHCEEQGIVAQRISQRSGMKISNGQCVCLGLDLQHIRLAVTLLQKPVGDGGLGLGLGLIYGIGGGRRGGKGWRRGHRGQGGGDRCVPSNEHEVSGGELHLGASAVGTEHHHLLIVLDQPAGDCDFLLLNGALVYVPVL
mmetsp:Transcript_44805/g.72961  ORF Transcript_44805/g.72961 Transcript_44805/m.72961 type:complete len:285 (-) Transcript_44805:4045-4899(-)